MGNHILSFFCENSCYVTFYPNGSVNVYVPKLDHTYYGETAEDAMGIVLVALVDGPKKETNEKEKRSNV